MTNKKSYESALKVMNQAIEILPQNPAGYNDRAQIERILRRDDDALVSLDKAITLSNGLGTVAAQAYTQRALMKKYANLTEDAASDFQAAAKLGESYHSLTRHNRLIRFCFRSTRGCQAQSICCSVQFNAPSNDE